MVILLAVSPFMFFGDYINSKNYIIMNKNIQNRLLLKKKYKKANNLKFVYKN